MIWTLLWVMFVTGSIAFTIVLVSAYVQVKKNVRQGEEVEERFIQRKVNHAALLERIPEKEHDAFPDWPPEKFSHPESCLECRVRTRRNVLNDWLNEVQPDPEWLPDWVDHIDMMEMHSTEPVRRIYNITEFEVTDEMERLLRLCIRMKVPYSVYAEIEAEQQADIERIKAEQKALEESPVEMWFSRRPGDF